MLITRKQIFQFVLSLVLTMGVARAQEKEDLGTQKVTVTKSYTPSLSDAFKLNTEEFDLKALQPETRKLEYQPQEIKVVSTFVPNKASPLKLQRKKREAPTNSQVSLGFGNLGQYLIDASVRAPLDSQQALGFDVFAEGEGSVPNTAVPSKRGQTEIAATHQYNTSQFSALHQLGFEMTNSYYYGVYPDDSTIMNSVASGLLDFEQQFYSVYAKSDWQWYDNWLENIQAKFRYSGDRFGTTEQFAHVAPNFRISIFNAFLDVTPSISFLQTTFQEDYFTKVISKYNQSKAGVQVQLADVRNKFKYKIGAKAQYFFGDVASDAPSYFIYPEVFMAYSDPKNKMQPYLKVSGNLRLNSYYSAFEQNPFVAPAIELQPTDEKYQGELGFTTLFKSGVEFQLAGQYSQADNFNLFQRFAMDPLANKNGYRLANSFGWIYDTVTRFGAIAGLKYKTKNQSEIQINIQQNTYNLDTQVAAWNLPDIEAQLICNLNIGSKIRWFTAFHFLGSRSGAYRPVLLLQDPTVNQAELKNIASVSYVKSEVSYQIYEQWNIFIRYRSVFGDTPYQWDFTPLNQNMLLLGARYKININL
ncbi:MAG: hypothetical protein ACPG4E_05580 [Flavobacteriaceae bacterium]